MDKTFEDIITDTLNDLDESNVDSSEVAEESTETEESEVESEPEIDENEEDTEESEVEDESEDTEEPEETEEVEEELDNEDLEDFDSSSSSTNTKDAEAFAKMRTENKQYKNIVNYFDKKAKEMGMSGIGELIEKTNEADLAKKAKSEGIPLEVAKRLQELEQKVEKQEAEREQAIEDAKYNRVKQSLNGFVQANNLDEKAVTKLAKDLIADGITLDFFKEVPDKTIGKILKSYLPSNFDKQKDLEKKEKIKKEVPVNSKSNGSKTNQTNEIDKIAKMLLERP